MSYARTYEQMRLTVLTPEWHERTCNYWYTVTTFGATAHTAFRTKAALLAWLERLGLTVDAEIPDPGTYASFPITGAYRRVSHFAADALDTLEGEKTLCLDNGEYTLGVITQDADGLRTLHHLNCNLPRIKFNHALSRETEDAGRALPSTEAAA